MKRWQDRGVVQDSDDEDFDLEVEANGPKNPWKRQRLEDSQAKEAGSGIDDEPTNSAGGDDEADAAWLEPKVATTYGRSRKTSRPASRDEKSDNGLSADYASGHSEGVDKDTTRSPGISNQPRPPITIPSNNGFEVVSESSDITTTLDRSQVDLREGPADEDQYQVQPEGSTHANTTFASSGARSNGASELSNASQLILPDDRARPLTPVDDNGNVSSALSSPLSSPETPALSPKFQLPRSVNAIALPASHTEMGSGEHLSEDAEVIAELEAEISSERHGRSFRTRTEKQLHPYMYDKTIYQQQWKQRGLRPVHYVDNDDRAAHESQDHSYEANDTQQRRQASRDSSSPARPSSASAHDRSSANPPPSLRPQDASLDDDDLPDIDTVLSRGFAVEARGGHKRRKVSRPSRPGQLRSIRHRDLDRQALGRLEETITPLSPPSTSSDLPQPFQARQLPSGFVMPLGMTPVALPTPQVSSDARVPLATLTDTDSGPPSRRRPRLPARALTPSRETSVDSSSGWGTDSASEQETDLRRLLRERKRIKGVLPASWLRIDLDGQRRRLSTSPTRNARPDAHLSPRNGRPLKGVAQRVPRPSTTPSHGRRIVISDDDSNADNDSLAPSASKPRQRHLNLDDGYIGIAKDIIMEDDGNMEVDWIDPMLAGPSGAPRRRGRSNKRQPRITDTFSRRTEGRPDFSEERVSLQHVSGTTIAGQRSERRPRDRRAGVPRARRRAAPSLSILDARDVSHGGSTVPPFVRLAQRQARLQQHLGRHSPTSKTVRLATKDETNEATVLLEAWRDGLVVPKASAELQQTIAERSHAARRETSSNTARQKQVRRPLDEVVNEQRTPQRLPLALRKESNDRTSRNPQIAMRRPRPVQPRLMGASSEESTDEVRDLTLEAGRRGQNRSRSSRQMPALRLRGAQLETLENAFDSEHRTVAFERQMNLLTEGVARPLRSKRNLELPLDRFLETNAAGSPRSGAVQSTVLDSGLHSADEVGPDFRPSRSRRHLPHRQRKRLPQRVDAESRQYRQPSEPLPVVVVRDDEVTAVATNQAVLQGLRPFGARYATDFDIDPLDLGTYFHQSTFIGSGDFAAALRLLERNLSALAGRMRIHVGEEVIELGAWTEEVAAGFSRIPRVIQEAVEMLLHPAEDRSPEAQLSVVTSNVDHMLRSVVRYCSKCLAFLDPVDRRTCVQHFQQLLESLADIEMSNNYRALRLKMRQYSMVIATQVCLLSEHEFVSAELSERSQQLKLAEARRLAGGLFPLAFEELRAFYEENRHASKREAGIRDEQHSVSAIIVLYHCLRDEPELNLWQAIKSAAPSDIGSCSTVSELDRVWYNVFTVLPILEIDAAGIPRPGSRFQNVQQDWHAITSFIKRLFELYPGTIAIRGTTVNDYVRATLVRCFRLVNRWGWSSCESVLGAVFDFFAQRSLASLSNEESYGSPRFLSDLEKQSLLEVQPEDRSFHIFLKMLATGLQGMQKYHVYSDRKIGGMTWRFIPNHGRAYRKDADLKQSDLAALRNHHDLLCTLYFASPPGHRLRLDLLRNLVDHAASHREACRLNVRAWSNLTSFQASSGEGVDSLKPFVEWFNDILSATTAQYRLAKSEAETDFAVAKAQGAVSIADSLLSSTIASNQRNIAATIVDALAGLKRALKAADSLPTMHSLVEHSNFLEPFVPFDAQQRRLYGAIEEALEVAKTALEVEHKFSLLSESQQISEESQDYGDSSALLEYASTQPALPSDTRTSSASVGKVLHECVAELMSNVFGADQPVDNHILIKLINVWIQLAKDSVRSGTRSWISYIDQYSSHSWHQLRKTEQTRKYSPYFLSRLVDDAGDGLHDVVPVVLSAWLVSLVEREAMLKFQHRLTSSLLEHAATEPLMASLPFVKNARSNTYNISPHDLRQRRLSLISSVLSNMRQHLDVIKRNSPHMAQARRKVYTEMLRAMMQAMKHNYQELQASSESRSADPSAHGAYVEFVHQVVSFLQQYTSEICKVDSFFTDSAAFPLPVNDPAYVVGKLRSYVPKLAHPGVQKQLAAYVQSISERAAADRQQQYLVNQLCASVDGVVECGNRSEPSLCHVLLGAVFPAYIENALATACSWIMCLPILEASAAIVEGLLYHIQWEDVNSVHATTNLVGLVLRGLLEPLRFALKYPGHLMLPHAQRILTLISGLGQSLLTVCRHLEHFDDLAVESLNALEHMRHLTRQIQGSLTGAQDLGGFVEAPNAVVWSSCEPWPETKAFTRRQLQASLQRDWHAHDGQYFFAQGNNAPKEVTVSLGDEEDVQADLLFGIVRFHESFDAIVDVGGRRQASDGLLDGVFI